MTDRDPSRDHTDAPRPIRRRRDVPGDSARVADNEVGWVARARANTALAPAHGGHGHRRILRGDATRLPRGVPADLYDWICLVLTSWPYGQTLHGRAEHRNGPLSRFHNTYSGRGQHHKAEPETGNLGHRGRTGPIDGIPAVLAGCLPLLEPDAAAILQSSLPAMPRGGGQR